jgi:hypothetical protein
MPVSMSSTDFCSASAASRTPSDSRRSARSPAGRAPHAPRTCPGSRWGSLRRGAAGSRSARAASSRPRGTRTNRRHRRRSESLRSVLELGDPGDVHAEELACDAQRSLDALAHRSGLRGRSVPRHGRHLLDEPTHFPLHVIVRSPCCSRASPWRADSEAARGRQRPSSRKPPRCGASSRARAVAIRLQRLWISLSASVSEMARGAPLPARGRGRRRRCGRHGCRCATAAGRAAARRRGRGTRAR